MRSHQLDRGYEPSKEKDNLLMKWLILDMHGPFEWMSSPSNYDKYILSFTKCTLCFDECTLAFSEYALSFDE